MIIAVIGSGKIGGTLRRKWAQAEREVVFGARNPADPGLQRLLAAAGAHVSTTTVAQAIAGGDVVVLAAPGAAMAGFFLPSMAVPLPARLSSMRPTNGAASIGDRGLRPVRVGDIDQARLVDRVSALWGAPGHGRGFGRHLAFKMLT